MPIHYVEDDFDPQSELGDWDGNLVEGDSRTYPVLEGESKRFNRIGSPVGLFLLILVIILSGGLLLIPVAIYAVISQKSFKREKCPLCGKKLRHVETFCSVPTYDHPYGTNRLYLVCDSCHIRLKTGVITGKYGG